MLTALCYISYATYLLRVCRVHLYTLTTFVSSAQIVHCIYANFIVWTLYFTSPWQCHGQCHGEMHRKVFTRINQEVCILAGQYPDPCWTVADNLTDKFGTYAWCKSANLLCLSFISVQAEPRVWASEISCLTDGAKLIITRCLFRSTCS